MTHKRIFRLLCRFTIFLATAMVLVSCAKAGASPEGSPASEEPALPDKKEAEIRPNTPAVHTPEAPGTSVLGQAPLVVDVSHTDQGYVMAKYSGASEKACIQILGPDGIKYKYFFPSSDEYVALPLTAGNGSYTLSTYESISGSRYSTLGSDTIEVQQENDYTVYLYPNQYVNFTPDSRAVAVAAEAVKDAASDLDAVAAVYHYVIKTISYDEEKADSVASGYLPDIDSTLESCKGICFDYAALMTAMLRSQNIPAKLEIGYSGKIYHAWISVYIKDMGWIDDIIEFDGKTWKRMDPTFASSNKSSKKILDYIGDGNNYTVRYTR